MSSVADKFKAALTSSSEAVLRRSLAIIYAGSGVGKTCAAMTISEQCPDLPSEKPVTILDTIHVGVDRGAADSLPGVGIEVKYYIDFNMVTELCDGNPVTALNETAKMILAICKDDPAVKNLVFDTLSAYIGKVVIYYDGKPAEFKNDRGNFDGQAFYRRILAVGKAAYDMVLKLPLNVVFLSHTKLDGTVVATGAGKERAELEAKAGGLSVQGKIEIDVVGQTSKLLTNESSIIMPMSYKRDDKGNVKRWFVIQDWDETFQVKNRFAPFLSKEEPPNLRKMFAKIKSGMAAKMGAT